MAKDPAHMTHAERMAALMRELNSSTFLAKADKMLELMKHEWLDVLGVREMGARRHGEAAPAPTMPTIATQAAVKTPPKRQMRNSERQGFDGSVASLIDSYKSDPDSGYQKLRYRTRENYDSLMRRIERDIGPERLVDIDARRLKRIHEKWSEGGRIAMAHALVTMLRTLSTFGATWLKSNECRELKITLSGMEFEMAKPRSEQLTAEHAIAIRAKAHEMNLRSAALAQAIQFEGMLRQKDVIGEVVPQTEPGQSDVKWDDVKWLRGIRWDEINDNLILRHTTSKLQSPAEIDLKLTPMVMEELQAAFGEPLTRAKLPASGPIIIYEKTGRPYLTHQFRRVWREIADAAGVPKTVMNMDSRAPARVERLLQRAGADEKPRYSSTDQGDEPEKDRPAGADLQPTGRVH